MVSGGRTDAVGEGRGAADWAELPAGSRGSAPDGGFGVEDDS